MGYRTIVMPSHEIIPKTLRAITMLGKTGLWTMQKFLKKLVSEPALSSFAMWPWDKGSMSDHLAVNFMLL